MQRRPFLDESHLPRRQPTSERLSGRNCNDDLVVTSPGVKVRNAVIPHVHLDGDPIEGGQPGHGGSYRWHGRAQ
jgi:UDP-N-acetylmuramoylalanine-D-glutamate ligase